MTRESNPVREPGRVGSHAPASVQSLKQAMRRARGDNAERAGVSIDLRAAQFGRLQMLDEALKPLIAQIPAEIDLFDIGLMPGATPRLFIDMIGFVEMGREARVYHFFQDTRHGRVEIAESAEIETMVDAVTDYVARRLLERDKALAAEHVVAPAGGARAAKAVPAKISAAKTSTPATATPKRGPLRWLGIGFAFLIDLLGSIAFFSILAGLAWVLWNKLHASV